MTEGISVIIPAYNAERTIVECLKGIREQTLLPLEVIVVDDNSSDSTVAIAKDWAFVISNTHKKGAAGARNSGIYVAKGEIITFIDSDCVPPKDWLKNIAFAFSDKTIGAIGGGYCCGADESFWQRFCYEELYFRRKKRKLYVDTLVSNNFACRRSLILQLGGFPEQYPIVEDMFLSFKISRISKVLWLPDNGVKHYFKDSLKAYLKHQYVFGAESTRFFLQHPEVLFTKNHQGRIIHVSIISAFFLAVSLFLGLSFMTFGNFNLGGKLLLISASLLFIHYLLNSNFIFYLYKVKFQKIIKAYGTLLLRDFICGISFFDGLFRAIKRQR